MKFKTRQNQDRYFAFKTRQDFQEIKRFETRQDKNVRFSNISRQDKTRQDSCQEKSRNIQDKINFCLIWVMKLENFAWNHSIEVNWWIIHWLKLKKVIISMNRKIFRWVGTRNTNSRQDKNFNFSKISRRDNSRNS